MYSNLRFFTDKTIYRFLIDKRFLIRELTVRPRALSATLCLLLSVLTGMAGHGGLTVLAASAPEAVEAAPTAPATAKETLSLTEMSVEQLLEVLDNTLAESDRYTAAKQNKIAFVGREIGTATDSEQRYWIARDLYNEYCSFDSDSALYYADMAIRLARETGHQSWVDEMQLNRAYVLAATGLLAEAQELLMQINPSSLQQGLEARYFEQLLFLYTHRDQYYGDQSIENPYDANASQMLDSLCRSLPPTDPQYAWFESWRNLSSPRDAAETIPKMKRQVDESSLSTRSDAMYAWILSRLYERSDDRDNMLRYLIISAIADIRAANKEIASLEEVANIVYNEYPGNENLKRANEYISYCIRCANEYKSRVRVGRLAELQHSISRSYQRELIRQERRATLYLILGGAFLLILVAAMVFIIVQMRRLRQSRSLLNEANRELNGKVEELTELRRQLEEANTTLEGLYSSAREGASQLSLTNQAKEKYIADIFAICSNYISKLDDFRKNIYRLLIAGKYEELRQITKSPELSQAEIKELHRTFDKVFLGIYPDFVSDFNSLLRPEERVELKKGDLLNTELRIYALVRLGLTDSTAIARFLHCSVQTVYNTRQRTRAKAIVPAKEFADTVRSLGKTIF